MDAEARNHVTELLRAGAKHQAQAILVSAIRKEPADEFAWLALAQAVDDVVQRRECLTRALAINPSNASAAQMLAELANEAPVAKPAGRISPIEPTIPAPTALPTPVIAAPAMPILEVMAAPAAPPGPKKDQLAPPRRGAAWLFPVAIGVLLIALTSVGIAGVLLIRAYALPTPAAPATALGPQPTPIRFPTLPPEWTATPIIPMVTARPHPSSTPAVSATSPAEASPAGPTQSPALSHLDYPLAYVVTDEGGARTAYLTNGSSLGIVISGATTLVGWLPAGPRLLYTTAGDASAYSLYSVAADGSQPQLVVHLPSTMGAPSVSPDGRQLAMVVSVGQRPKSDLHLDVLNIDGSQRKTIYSIPELDSALVAGDWSPDGKRIALVQQQCVNGTIGTAEVFCDAELYVINRDGTGLQQLTFDVHGVRGPRWSPDGSQIVFYDASPDLYDQFWSQLMLLNLDGSEPQMLTLDGYTDINLEEPECSPDGKWIVFRGLKGQASVYIIPAACFGAPKLCSWQDATRLPVQSGYIANFIWKGSPPLAAAVAVPTIPAVTAVIPLTEVVVPIGTFSGQDSGRTAFFALASGTIRVDWKYTGPANSKFQIVLAHNSTQEVVALDGSVGSGAGRTEYFVLFPGRDYFFVVKSLGQWTLDVSFKPTQ